MNPNLYTQALVRPPGANYVNAIAMVPQPIDVTLAQKQHAEYVDALQAAGVTVEALPADERFPDSCFMQDPAMVVGGIAILNRMGAESRAGEPDLVADVLCGKFETHRIQEPATLEGGDVLNVGHKLLVGETERTNAAGIAQLRALVAASGMTVEAVPVREYLHLLTVVTYAGQGVVIVHEDFAEHPQLGEFRKVIVPREEAYVANTLGIGKYVIVPAGFPKTVERIRGEGFEMLQVPMSEFYKADGGVSCLSLIW
jgi:dimethylargininase